MAESEKVYSFLNDFLFKLVFGKKSHEHLTIRLLNSLLQLDKNNEIKELEFLNPFNEKDYKDDKISIVDTRVKDASGKFYNIEMQARKEKSFTKRFAYYIAKMYSNQLDNNEKYDSLNPAIGIALLGFNLYENSKEIDEVFTFKNKNSEILLLDIMQMHFINLSKPINKPLSEMTRFEKWVNFLYNSKKYAKPGTKLPSEYESEEYMKEAIDYAQKANSDRNLREIMRDRERFLIDQRLDRAESYQEGRFDEKSDMIKAMLSNGATKETILKLTGISEIEFNQIINS